MLTETAQFQILGHRGSPRRAVENTVASLQLAIDEGAAGFETDVRTLRDGTIVLFHDDEFGGKATEEWSFDELATRVPGLARLDELEQFAGRVSMTLEIKRSGNEAAIAAQIAKWERVVVSSFDHRVLPRLRAAGYGGALGVVYFGYLAATARYASELGASVIYPAYRYVDRALVDDCSARGIAVVPWTPNTPTAWQQLRDAGCAGVITDDAKRAVLWRRALR